METSWNVYDYPEPPEEKEEDLDWDEYEWELADIYHDELMIEELLERDDS